VKSRQSDCILKRVEDDNLRGGCVTRVTRRLKSLSVRNLKTKTKNPGSSREANAPVLAVLELVWGAAHVASGRQGEPYAVMNAIENVQGTLEGFEWLSMWHLRQSFR
jgi:hypothetical protein